jgi:hypothetical protein
MLAKAVYAKVSQAMMPMFEGLSWWGMALSDHDDGALERVSQ